MFRCVADGACAAAAMVHLFVILVPFGETDANNVAELMLPHLAVLAAVVYVIADTAVTTATVQLFPPDGIECSYDVKAAAAAMASAALFAIYAAAGNARFKPSKKKRWLFYVAVHVGVLVALAADFVASALT
jgi:hypothetical protein